MHKNLKLELTWYSQDPRQLLEDGIRKELAREIENTFNNFIVFSAGMYVVN